MEIYCQKCQKRVGQVADEKIPVGQKASVKCPACGEKIILSRVAVVEPENTIEAGKPTSAPPPPGISVPGRQQGSDGDFAIGAILKEAWQKTSGVKGPVWGAMFMAVMVLLAMAIGVRMLAAMFGGDGDNFALGMALQITSTVAVYPIIAGVMMIGIRRSVELPVNWKMAFGYYSFLLPLVVSYFLVTMLTLVGFLLLLLPGIYLSLAYIMVMPLVVDKGMPPWQAMEASRKAIHKHWFKVFGLYFVMMLIILVSLVPLGLGLIWTMPMVIMVGAILYRELFEVSEKA